MKGYACKFKRFWLYRKELRTIFQIKQHWIDQATDSILRVVRNHLFCFLFLYWFLFQELKGKTMDEVTLVSVHVRRTDMIPHLERFYSKWKVPDENYYEAAFEYYHKRWLFFMLITIFYWLWIFYRYSNVVFAVLSDDLTWCRIKLNQAMKYHLIYPGNIIKL